MLDHAKDWVGRTLSSGRYRVDAKLGEGGMGFVYKAWDRNLDTDVVVKAPRKSMLDDPDFSGRFALEIRSLVKLSHPNIVKLTDVGEHDDLPFAVMQYLAGGTLDERQVYGRDGRPKPASPASLATWLPGMASALDFIHGKGYIHRDVKPANILFDANGHPYLSDFGVAKVLSEVEAVKKAPSGMTGIGVVLGTPEYMAPELIMGHAFDGRVDQYALAASTYEILCGRKPFDGQTATAILVRQTRDQPPSMVELPASCLFAISRVIFKAMAKKPGDRFATCAEFADALLATLGRPVLDRPTPDRLACPSCGLGFVATADLSRYRGRKSRCRACGAPFRITDDGLNLVRIDPDFPPSPSESVEIPTTNQPQPTTPARRATPTVKLDASPGPKRVERTMKLDALPNPSRVERTMKLEAMPEPAWTAQGTMKLEAMPTFDPDRIDPVDELDARSPLVWIIGGASAFAVTAILGIILAWSPAKPSRVDASGLIHPPRTNRTETKDEVVKRPSPAPPAPLVVPTPSTTTTTDPKPVAEAASPPASIEPEVPAVPLEVPGSPVANLDPPPPKPVAIPGTFQLRQIVADPFHHFGEVIVPSDLLSVNTGGGRDANLSVRGQGGAYPGFVNPAQPFRLVLEDELLGQLRGKVNDNILVDGDYPAMMGLNVVEDPDRPGGYVGKVVWLELLYYIDPRPLVGSSRIYKDVYSVVHLGPTGATTGRSKNYAHWQKRIQTLTTAIRNKYEIAGKPANVEVMAIQASNPSGHATMFHRWILAHMKSK